MNDLYHFLALEGFMQGNPIAIQEMPLYRVFAMLDFVTKRQKEERQFHEQLNTKKYNGFENW